MKIWFAILAFFLIIASVANHLLTGDLPTSEYLAILAIFWLLASKFETK